MSAINFIHKSPEVKEPDGPSPKLISEEQSLKSVNDEFNQYVEYYMQLIRLKSQGTVLIVEDDIFSRKVIENAIREFNSEITILVASSEAEALSLLQQSKCDLVIADYYLEGDGTGLDLCQKILSTYPHTKCIMMSNMKFFEYKEKAKETDLTPEFMEKPVKPSLIQKYLTSFFEDRYF